MGKDVPSTSEHRGPEAPEAQRRRPAFICAFPLAGALALPDSGRKVGRAWLRAIGIDDVEVSGEHLAIDRVGGRISIADVGSRNGTWVNGHRLTSHEKVALDDGAILRLGKTLLVFRERLLGAREPAPPIGGTLVGPFGLRVTAESIDGLARVLPRNILVEGETGVGKELAARAIAHALGRASPFAAVNVAGIAKSVFESQMFGHVAGAFSDAKTASPGLILSHDKGALFLDEIGELDLDLQVKLLRVLENREILPVGASRPVAVDVVFIGATNRDLEKMVAAGDFRRDLHARLSMVRVPIPPLRERIEDLFAVAEALAERAGCPLPSEGVEVEAVERLMLEAWPSNVRELDALLGAARRLDPKPGLRTWVVEELLGKADSGGRPPLTEASLEDAITRAGGNLTKAAGLLGISRGKLLRARKR